MNHVEVKRRQIQAYSYLLGVITLIVIGRIIGDNGLAYLAAAVEGMLLFFLPAGYCVADALGRQLRGRNARSQYKNAARMRKNIMIFQCGAGILGGAALFGLSGLLEKYVFRIPNSALAMKILAPVLVIRVVSCVLQGYFQGSGTEMPTVMTSVLRQIFLLGFGLLFCNIFKGYGEKVSALLKNSSFTQMYGVVGLAIAMILTELLLFLFLLLIYLGSRRKGREGQDGLKLTETFAGSVRSLVTGIGVILPVLLLVKLPVWLGMFFRGKSAGAAEYGVYYGKYLVLCSAPILLLSAGMLPLCARVASIVKREEYRYSRDVFGTAFQIGIVNTLFAAVFMAVLSKQIAGALFTESAELAADMLLRGSGLVMFAVMSFFFLRILLLLGRQIQAFVCMAIYNVIYIAALLLLVNAAPSGIMGLVYAGLAAGGVLSLISGVLAFRLAKGRLDPLKALAVPAFSAGVTGLVCMLLAKVLTPHLGNSVAFVVCLAAGCLLYWILLLLLRSFREPQLGLIPGGAWVKQLARLLRVV